MKCTQIEAISAHGAKLVFITGKIGGSLNVEPAHGDSQYLSIAHMGLPRHLDGGARVIGVVPISWALIFRWEADEAETGSEG